MEKEKKDNRAADKDFLMIVACIGILAAGTYESSSGYQR